MGLSARLIGDFLHRIRRPIELNPDQRYKLVTVKMNHKGVVLREKKLASDIKSKMYEVKEGDFILSGIVPKELDGAIVTNDFWYFDIDSTVVDKDFFLELTATQWFDEICRKGSDGTTQRIRLQKNKFFNQEIPLPPIEEQGQFISQFKKNKQNNDELKSEFAYQQTLLKKLRQQILQEAIEGKLTADLPSRQAGWRDSAFKNYSGRIVPKESNGYFAYVLECEDGSLYKGSTQNLFNRINRHLEGRGAKKTQQSKPIRLIHFDEFSTEHEAINREKYFKSGSGREWFYAFHKERVKENEPASELLKRIQAEKQQLIQDKKIKKQKPLPPISEDDLPAGKAGKPFELPEGWVWCRVWDIAQQITSGSRGWAQYYADCGAIFVTMGNLSKDSYQLRMDKIRYVQPPKNSEGARTKLEQGAA